MNASFLYIADREGLKTYCVEGDVLQLLEFYPVDEASGRWREPHLMETTTASRMKTPSWQRSTAIERLRIEAETEMRCFRKISTRLRESLDEHAEAGWSFAAPGEFNEAILDGLPSRYRSRLVQNVHADLLNLPEEDLATHFDLHAKSSL